MKRLGRVSEVSALPHHSLSIILAATSQLLNLTYEESVNRPLARLSLKEEDLDILYYSKDTEALKDGFFSSFSFRRTIS